MATANSFGTTEEMVIRQIEMAGKMKSIAIDDKGLYITSPDRVGRNVADVNRYGVDRRVFISEIEAAGLDAEQLFEENRHRIVSGSTAVTEKKINPIKASKRGGA